jgi:DNA-binding NarL/FixJ family response regulator
MTLLIVDDYSIVRKGMKCLISSVYPDWTIFEAQNGVQAIVTAFREKPDLVLMDQIMPKLDGLKAASIIMHDLHKTKVILVTMSNREDILSVAKDTGINCVISKEASDGEILKTITEFLKSTSKEGVNKKEKRSTGENRKLLTGKRPDRHTMSILLTDREFDVAELLMKGYTTYKIADYLGISNRTVEGHKSQIMRKFNLHSSPDLIRFLINNNILFAR